MKNSIIFFIIILSSSLYAGSNGIESVLNDYLKIKDALVSADVERAAEYASNLSKSITLVKTDKLIDAEKKAFESEYEKMKKAAKKIAEVKEIEKQRIEFELLSVSLWKVLKASDNISQDVYYQYCPMKKAYWISGEAAIKNPYYGNKMLTCGNVAEKKLIKNE